MTYVRGQHNVISDDSGQKFKSGEMRKTWDNKLVHESEWEAKHPQLTIIGREDKQAVTNARPRQDPPTFVTTGSAVMPENNLDDC